MTHSSLRRLSGTLWIFVGIGLCSASRALDGFWSGLLIGAGLSLLLCGVLVLSRSWRGDGGWLPTEEREGGAWLPSRGEPRR